VNPASSVQHYENFPVASWLCPPRLRGAVQAIYHFARTADDLADEGTATAEQRLKALSQYRHLLNQAVGPATKPVTAPLLATNRQAPPLAPPATPSAAQDTPAAWASIFGQLRSQAQAHGLPAQPFHDLLDAFCQDASNPIYEDRADLLDYCAKSANPVGRLLLHLYGMHDAASLRQSDAICSALQLANFWQDLSVDLPRHRCYVPEREWQRHGMTRLSLLAGNTAASRALVADLVTWTRGLMLQGCGLPLRIPGRAGWELRLVVQGGLLILDKLEANNFDALTRRPTVGRGDALQLLWRAVSMRSTPGPAQGHEDTA
jgi:hydroxysqualene synthase